MCSNPKVQTDFGLGYGLPSMSAPLSTYFSLPQGQRCNQHYLFKHVIKKGAEAVTGPKISCANSQKLKCDTDVYIHQISLG